MGNISIQIPQRNFELIRDNIGSILILELSDQDYTNEVSVWRERNTPFDIIDLPAVNISFDSNSNLAQTTSSKRNENTYFIDVTVNSKHSDITKGDVEANLKCQRICGIIDYILSCPEYQFLDFEIGLIESRWISDINIGRLQNQDSRHTVTGRITFKVRAREDVNKISGTQIKILGSQVKLDLTDKGYKFELLTDEAVSLLTDETILTDQTILI